MNKKYTAVNQLVNNRTQVRRVLIGLNLAGYNALSKVSWGRKVKKAKTGKKVGRFCSYVINKPC